jgi:hypothetical protein
MITALPGAVIEYSVFKSEKTESAGGLSYGQEGGQDILFGHEKLP